MRGDRVIDPVSVLFKTLYTGRKIPAIGLGNFGTAI